MKLVQTFSLGACLISQLQAKKGSLINQKSEIQIGSLTQKLEDQCLQGKSSNNGNKYDRRLSLGECGSDEGFFWINSGPFIKYVNRAFPLGGRCLTARNFPIGPDNISNREYEYKIRLDKCSKKADLDWSQVFVYDEKTGQVKLFTDDDWCVQADFEAAQSDVDFVLRPCGGVQSPSSYFGSFESEESDYEKATDDAALQLAYDTGFAAGVASVPAAVECPVCPEQSPCPENNETEVDLSNIELFSGPGFNDDLASQDPQNYSVVNEKAQVYIQDQGFFQGQVRDNVMAFNGIPYAQAPVGQLRWQPAMAPFEPHQGVFQANGDITRVPSCWTFGEGESSSDPDVMSEDCLFMNIITPKVLDKGPLPVLFFVHGGNWRRQMGNDNLYNGNRLAKEENVITVTFGFRQGPLGYLRLDDQFVTGNQAVSDILQALRWVKKNIASFSGDPDNVTMMGQSAGADLVAYFATFNQNHIDSEEINSLFHKAVITSAPWSVPGRNVANNSPPSYPANAGQQELIGGNFLQLLKPAFLEGANCTSLPLEHMVGCAFRATPEEIFAAQAFGLLASYIPAPGSTDKQPLMYASSTISPWAVTIKPNDNTAMFTMSNEEAFRQGKIRDIPIILGATSADGFSFGFDFVNTVETMMGMTYTDANAHEPMSSYNILMNVVLRQNTSPVLGLTSPDYPYFYVNPCMFTDDPSCDSRTTFAMFVGDIIFRCPMVGHLLKQDLIENQGRTAPYYNYLFDAPAQSTLDGEALRNECDNFFSCHSADTAFWFGSFDKDRHNYDEDDWTIQYRATEEDWELSKKMRTALANFARSGDPNSAEQAASADDCWEAINIPGYSCQNQEKTSFIKRFFREGEEFWPSDYQGEEFLKARCEALETIDTLYSEL